MLVFNAFRSSFWNQPSHNWFVDCCLKAFWLCSTASSEVLSGAVNCADSVNPTLLRLFNILEVCLILWCENANSIFLVLSASTQPSWFIRFWWHHTFIFGEGRSQDLKSSVYDHLDWNAKGRRLLPENLGKICPYQTIYPNDFPHTHTHTKWGIANVKQSVIILYNHSSHRHIALISKHLFLNLARLSSEGTLFHLPSVSLLVNFCVVCDLFTQFENHSWKSYGIQQKFSTPFHVRCFQKRIP